MTPRIPPRMAKVRRDLLARRGRVLLVAIAMAAGLFEIGAAAWAYARLRPALSTMYARTRPSSATLVTDAMDDATLAEVRRVPGVAAAVVRPVIVARVRVGADEWTPALLQVIRDFDRLEIDTFRPESGAWPPGPGEVLLERTALRVARARVGDSLRVRIPGAGERRVRLAGTVYAAGLPPAWMEHMVPGFVGWTSVLRGAGESAQLRIVATHPLDEGFVRATTDSVAARLAQRGVQIRRVTVPPVGQHPHAAQMAAFLFLLLAFGILSLVLGAVLVATMVHGILAEERRDLAVMRALGATRAQVAAIYRLEVVALSVAALALGLPAGFMLGAAYARFAAGILNADLSGAGTPWWPLAVLVVLGIGLPLLVCEIPLRRAAALTVREALDPDAAARATGFRGLELRLAASTLLPRPVALSWRAILAARGRLALTLGMLAVGGAAFMAARNVGDAWRHAVADDFARRRYDLMVALADDHPAADLARALAGVPVIARAEYWPAANAWLETPDGVAGPSVPLVGPDPGSRLLDLRLESGRWLAPGDRDVAVVNRGVLHGATTAAVGDTLRLRGPAGTVALRVVGVVRELTPQAVVYAPPAAVLAVSGGRPGLTRGVRIVTRAHGDAAQLAAQRALERSLAAAGIEVRAIQRMADARQGILDHLVIITTLLTIASLVVVFVAALALASTLVWDVVRRTREFGILRALGATPRALARQVWLEALLVAALSALPALALAAPLSAALESACGRIFFKVPLDFRMAPSSFVLWLAVLLVVASVCALAPARRATRLEVREALAHV